MVGAVLLRRMLSMSITHGDRSTNRTIAFLGFLRLALNTAFRFVYPFLPVIARGLGITLPQAGWLVSARWLGASVTPVVISAIGKGESRRKAIRVGLTLFVVGVAASVAGGGYVGALVGFMLYGLGKSVFDVTVQAYISDRVPYEQRARKMGYLEMSWGGSLLVGAPLAGWLIERAGWQAPFWVLAGLALGGLLLTGRFLEPDSPSLASVAQRLALTRSSRALLGVVVMFALAAEVLFVVFGAWLESSFGLSISALGLSAVVLAIAELAGEGFTVGFTDKVGKRRSMLGGLLISIIAFGLMAALGASQGAALAMFAVGLFGFEWTIVSMFPLATSMHENGKAKYLALVAFAMGISRAIGAAVGPVLFEAGGLTSTVVVAVAADVIAVILLLTLVREAPGVTSEDAKGN